MRFAQRLVECGERGLAAARMHHDLGDHRIVEGRDRVAGAHAGLDADLGAVAHRRGKRQVMQRAGGGQEALRGVLGIEPRLEGVAVERDFALLARQLLAGRDPQLPFDEVDAGHHLGHRMLDLQPRVHLHEPEPVGAQPLGGVGDEFDRAGARIVDRLGGRHRGFGHRPAHLLAHAGRGRLLDHLLVAALRRAVALEQMHGIAVIVAENLHLDMARLLDIFLDQHAVVAEGALGLALGRRQRLAEMVGVVDLAHALAAAAGARLDQHRIADLARLGGQHHVLLRLAVIARHHRHAGLFHQPFRRVLEAHRADRIGRGADEHQPRRRHLVDEIRVLRQEAVAGMDRLSTGGEGRLDDALADEIAFGRRRGADMHRMVCKLGVQRAAVGVGIDGDGGDAHAAGGADDAAGNFAAICDQDFREWRSHPAGLSCRARGAKGQYALPGMPVLALRVGCRGRRKNRLQNAIGYER